MGRQRLRLVGARKNAGLTQEELAARLGVDRSTVGRWETGVTEPHAWIRPKLARILQISTSQLGYLLSKSSVIAERHDIEWGTVDGAGHSPLAGVELLMAQIADSTTNDSVIQHLAHAVNSLAESHTQTQAKRLLDQVLGLHAQVRELATRRQRLSQRRELFRIDSEILAHACLLFGDLKQNHVAEKYGRAALECASEAGSSQAAVRTALAKTLRWENRFAESMDMARAGFEGSPATLIRVQLANQEANAAALMGDSLRARDALDRAEHAARAVARDSGRSVWSFPVGRRAIFALSVATHTGNPEAALHAAAMAASNWESGEPLVPATWAQIKIGAGIARLALDSIDGMIHEIDPVLTMPAQLRVSTVTGYMDSLENRLKNPRYTGNKAVSELRGHIREFSSGALVDGPLLELR